MNQNTNPVTLEDVATRYGELNGEFGQMEPLASAFEAGAQWQKEQDKELLSFIEKAVLYLRNGGFDDISEFGKLYLQGQRILDKFNP